MKKIYTNNMRNSLFIDSINDPFDLISIQFAGELYHSIIQVANNAIKIINVNYSLDALFNQRD